MGRLAAIAAGPATVAQAEEFVMEALRLAAAGAVSRNECTDLRWMTHRRLWLANTVMRPPLPPPQPAAVP